MRVGRSWADHPAKASLLSAVTQGVKFQPSNVVRDTVPEARLFPKCLSVVENGYFLLDLPGTLIILFLTFPGLFLWVFFIPR